jgi:hypothetical protein
LLPAAWLMILGSGGRRSGLARSIPISSSRHGEVMQRPHFEPGVPSPHNSRFVPARSRWFDGRSNRPQLRRRRCRFPCRVFGFCPAKSQLYRVGG